MKTPKDKPTPPGGPQEDLPGGNAARRLEQFLQGRFGDQTQGPSPTYLNEEDLKTEFHLQDPAVIGETLDHLLAAQQTGKVSSLEEAYKFVDNYLQNRQGPEDALPTE